jgi:putative Mg2+ transporter-C (MgtC) family protein
MMLAGELLLRLVVGTALGGIIGYERDVHGRPAGLRTHLIVALASTTFMLVSTHFVYFQSYGKGDLINVDASRIAASVVTGIGFLGGGAILRTGLTVQGLTTAAGLWLVAAIGLSAGAGMYVVSVAATVIGLLALAVLRRFENKDDRLLRRRISLVFVESGPAVPGLLDALVEIGVVVSPAEYERRIDDEHRVHVTLQARVPVGGTKRLVDLLESQPGLERVRVEAIA